MVVGHNHGETEVTWLASLDLTSFGISEVRRYDREIYYEIAKESWDSYKNGDDE